MELKLQTKLSPLQIQTIKLIELPIQELEQRIRKELEENPVLEEDTSLEDSKSKDVSLDEYKADDTPSYKLYVNNYGKDERPQYNTFSVKESFTQSLMDQLGYCDISEHERQVAAFLIGSLDDRGYLSSSIDKIVDDMAFRANIMTTDEEALRMLRVIQGFDPAGVGARDLRECLLLQLETDTSRLGEISRTILRDYYNEFTSRHFQKIISRLGLSEEEFRDAVKRISKLNPSPGGQIDDSYNDQAQQIVPDFILNYENGTLSFDMPRFNIPELKVNRKYANILLQAASSEDREAKEAAAFVKKKLD